MLEAKAPLSIDNFDACDYIFLNHAHPDHYLNIKEFVDKFHPPISVDSLYAAELSRTIGIELAYIFPVDRTQLPLPGLPPRCLLREPQRADRDRLRQLYLHGKAVWHQGHGGAGQYGSLFNTNFMLTLPNGYKVGSVAGIDNLNQAEAWRNNQPNLLLHQRMVYTKPEDYAQEVIDLGGQMGIVEA